MSFIVITGTGTDIGKTVVTAAVTSGLSARGLDVLPIKPVQTGEVSGSGDIASVAKLSRIHGREWIRYPDPLAPNLAARRAGQPQLDGDALIQWLRGLDAPGRVVVIEGSGGLLVRLNDETTIADIALSLGAPLLIVTSTGLGSLNTAELTVEAARRRGIRILGLVGGSVPAEPDLATQLNLKEFEKVTGVEFLGALPADCGRLSQEEFASVARGLRLPFLPGLSPLT